MVGQGKGGYPTRWSGFREMLVTAPMALSACVSGWPLAAAGPVRLWHGYQKAASQAHRLGRASCAREPHSGDIARLDFGREAASSWWPLLRYYHPQLFPPPLACFVLVLYCKFQVQNRKKNWKTPV